MNDNKVKATVQDSSRDPTISELKEKYTLDYVKDYVIKNYPDSCAAYNIPNGVCEESELEEILKFFAYDILDLCGCGIPEHTWEVIRRVLHAQNIFHSDRIDYTDLKAIYKDSLNLNLDQSIDHGVVQFCLYILDSKGLLEHGGSVGGSWLTELGKMYLSMLTIWYDELEKEESDK